MRFQELLEYKGPKTKQHKYRGFLLVHTIEQDKEGNYNAVVYQGTEKVKDLKNSDLDALTKEFETFANQSEMAGYKENLKVRDKVDANDVQKAGLNPNTEFTRQILENEVPTAIRIGSVGGVPIVDVMTLQWFDEFGTEDSGGFQKLSDTNWSKKAKTKRVGARANPKHIDKIGLEFHGVYQLTDMKSPDPDMFKRYKLDQVGYSDKTTYPVPAITIAYWLKKSKGNLGETASAGGTSAGGVATVVGGIGSGFTDDDSASIYNKKKKKNKNEEKVAIIRRPAPISGK